MARLPARSHRIADIAEQCGLSAATVDRVLHGRAGASARAVRAVEQAVLELDRQQSQLRLAARTLLLDVIVQAPARFSTAVRSALEDELPSQRPAAVRARFHLRENADVTAAVEALDAVGSAGRVSHGVLLKAPDAPEVAAAIDRASARGIPVVTLVTDVPGSRRVAYVGLDNTAAGTTAAYLIGQVLGSREGDVLLTLSRSFFVGERERAEAFAAALGSSGSRRSPVRPASSESSFSAGSSAGSSASTTAPGPREPGSSADPTPTPLPPSSAPRRLHTVTDTDGLDSTLGSRVTDLLAAHPEVAAVYSVGGGNRATLEAFAAAGRRPLAFIAHDLDRDNLYLLRTGALTAVLHHDLQADMRHAVRQILRAHGLARGAPTSVAANVEIVTPHNIPPRLPRY